MEFPGVKNSVNSADIGMILSGYTKGRSSSSVSKAGVVFIFRRPRGKGSLLEEGLFVSVSVNNG